MIIRGNTLQISQKKLGSENQKLILVLPLPCFATTAASGAARGWDKCFSAAGEICGLQGYDVLDKNSEGMVAIGGNLQGAFGGKTNERTMLIACKVR